MTAHESRRWHNFLTFVLHFANIFLHSHDIISTSLWIQHFHKVECWFRSWDIGGFLEQYFTHRWMSQHGLTGKNVISVCCESKYLNEIFCTKHSESILPGSSCTNKQNKIHDLHIGIPHTLQRCKPHIQGSVVWKDCAGRTPVCYGCWVSTEWDSQGNEFPLVFLSQSHAKTSW